MDTRPFQGEQHFTLANGNDISLYLIHDHIALIPLFKIVKRTSALRMARMQRQHFISEFRRYSTPGHGTKIQAPLDSVGMQPHREQPQATNLMDLL